LRVKEIGVPIRQKTRGRSDRAIHFTDDELVREVGTRVSPGRVARVIVKRVGVDEKEI
jgi:hypothetical protein